MDTRSFDGKTTLLHYLVAHLENKDEDLLQFTSDLPHLERAARLTFAQVEEELAPLHKGLGALASEVAAATERVEAAETKKAEREATERSSRADRAAKMARADPRQILGGDDDDEDEDEASLEAARIKTKEKVGFDREKKKKKKKTFTHTTF